MNVEAWDAAVLRALCDNPEHLKPDQLSGVHPEPGRWHLSVSDNLGWPSIARQLSERLPGRVWITSAGLSYQPHRAVVGGIVESESVKGVEGARVALRSLGLRDDVYSAGKAGRIMLDWVFDGKPPRYNRAAETLLEGVTFGYHDCQPGTYQNATMYDVSGYYFTLLSRLTSLRIEVNRAGKIRVPRRWLLASEGARWRDVLEAVAPHKVCRNALAGGLAAGGTPAMFYSKGKATQWDIYPSGLRAAGLLIVRTGWELCREASEEVGSVYSIIDAVTAPEAPTRPPNAWARHGITASPRYTTQGENKRTLRDVDGLPKTLWHVGGKEAVWEPTDAHICQRSSYRIGTHPTKPYNLQSRSGRFVMREPVPVPRAAAPLVNYAAAWL